MATHGTVSTTFQPTFQPLLIASGLLSHIFQNPAGELGDTSAHTGKISFSTANAPTDDSAQKVLSILTLNLHGSAGIALLTTILVD